MYLNEIMLLFLILIVVAASNFLIFLCGMMDEKPKLDVHSHLFLLLLYLKRIKLLSVCVHERLCVYVRESFPPKFISKHFGPICLCGIGFL